MNSLHELEIKVLKILQEKKSIKEEDLIKQIKLNQGSVRKGAGLLIQKKLIIEKKNNLTLIKPLNLAKKYAIKGLPEQQMIEMLKTSKTIKEIKSKMNDEEFNYSIGYLRKNEYIKINEGKITLTKKGRSYASKSVGYKKIIEMLIEQESYLENFPNELRDEVSKLLKRKEIFETKKETIRTFNITTKGYEIDLNNLKKQKTRLTTEMLKSGEIPELRPFNVKSPVKTLNPGKKNSYLEYLKLVEEKLIQLGFQEMRGTLVENEFWNMDALFMPQFHSARDIHDAYYVKKFKQSKPIIKEKYDKVKESHELNWNYKFDEKKARRLILRTQGTSISARTLANNPKIPGKYYSVARCFRYDVIDRTHLPDFEQVEGIILDPDTNFKKMLGVLEMFAKEVAGATEVKFRPGYFPFTEPSVELFAKHPDLGWIEIGGAGIFRPELTKPLGVNVPVLAWGLGVGRMAMLRMKTKDIRNLISQDLKWLRNSPIIKEL